MNWFGIRRIRAINDEEIGDDLDFLHRRQKFNWALCVGVTNMVLIICTIIFVYTNCAAIMEDVKDDVKDEIEVTVKNIKGIITSSLMNTLKDDFGDFKYFTNETLNFIHGVTACAEKSGLCHL
jgi:hypothetical protein